MHRFSVLLAAAAAASLSLTVAGHEARADFEAPTPPELRDLRELLPPGAPLATADEGDNERPGEILVDLRDDVSDTDIADVAASYGLRLTPNSRWSEGDKFRVADVDPAAEEGILERLAQDPRVENAERMYLYRATFVPNDPLYESRQWHLKRVGAESAWEYACGRGVTVAVIDTGIACFDKGPFSRGTDLSGTRCEGGYNFVDKTPEAYDDHGHGTHVAGTIAQTTNNAKGTAGLAFCATLMPVKVLTKQGYGTSADVAEGIRFAADNGAQVMNLSLGGPIRSKVIADAVKHARSKGVIVVAAAGNSGRGVGYPAAYPGVIAVSATDAKDKIAWFSSRGPELAIAAPGVGVTQQTVCNNGRDKCEIFGTFSGTSMASPHVAGAAAMLVGLGVTDADAVRAALQSTAEPKDEPKLYGAGILNVGAAAARAYWWRLGLRVLALLTLGALVRRRIRKRGGEPNRSVAVLAAALLTAVGLLPFAPFLGLASHAGDFRWVAELATRPFGEWDLPLLGASWHRWLPLASAVPTMVLSAVFFGVKRLRGLLGGFALGAAALLAQLAVSADVSFVGGAFLLRVWTVANAFVCLWLARVALDRKGDKAA